jgi:homoserine kinase
MTASVTVRVPGSTANLGSGFDCVGIAIDRWIRVVARREASEAAPIRLQRRGALHSLTVPPDQDLLYLGFSRACRAAGREPPPGIVIEASSDIPIGRGLGSSAAAVVAGAVAARALCDLALDDAALAAVCAAIEGHADNVAASVWGGAVLVLEGAGGHLLFTPLEVHESLVLTFAVPGFTVSTERARAVLPATVAHRTAVVAAARSAALVHGLARADPALLALGLDDVLHVPHRRALVRGYDEVTAAARAAGAFGATLSGSGSTIVAVGPAACAPAVEAAMAQAWRGRGAAAETFSVTRPAGGYEAA